MDTFTEGNNLKLRESFSFDCFSNYQIAPPLISKRDFDAAPYLFLVAHPDMLYSMGKLRASILLNVVLVTRRIKLHLATQANLWSALDERSKECYSLIKRFL